jgi:predicted DNA-binding transcriptional regulator AlpA
MPLIPDAQRSPFPRDVDSAALDDWLSFADLRKAGIVRSWEILRIWQEDPRVAFPRGKLFAPNSRRWSKSEIVAWINSRPTDRAEFDAERNDGAGGDEAA